MCEDRCSWANLVRLDILGLREWFYSDFLVVVVSSATPSIHTVPFVVQVFDFHSTKLLRLKERKVKERPVRGQTAESMHLSVWTAAPQFHEQEIMRHPKTRRGTFSTNSINHVRWFSFKSYNLEMFFFFFLMGSMGQENVLQEHLSKDANRAGTPRLTAVEEWLILSKRNFKFDLGDVLLLPSAEH